jgi:tetratricopeptide (TPR) repeat protein
MKQRYLGFRASTTVLLVASLLVLAVPSIANVQRSKRKAKTPSTSKSNVKSIVVTQSFENAAAAKLFDEAVSFVNEKRFTEAATRFEETLPYLRADEDKRGEANVLNNVGVTYALAGDHVKAGEYYERSLALAQGVNDEPAQASVLYNLGVSAYKLDKDPSAVLEYFTRALELYQRTKNRTGEADTLFNMGQVYQWNGDSGKAKEYYNRSLQVRVQ